MVRLVVIDRADVESVVETNTGNTLMEAIRDSGFGELLAVCGGCCSCATCHVHIDPAYLDKVPKMKSEEDELLSTSLDRDETSRLSCQLVVNDGFDGMRVVVAQED
jgi:2Fe-2S ferredoxin